MKALLLFETRKWQTSELSGKRNTLMDAVDPDYAGLIDDAHEINLGVPIEMQMWDWWAVLIMIVIKYLVQASFEYDAGSSNFTIKMGFFPSLSVGWRNFEEFIRDNFSFIDNLKLRASIGRMEMIM